jgi:hypothetical protein
VRRAFATLGALCLLLVAPARFASAAPAHHALLIAINEYASPDIPRLRGPHNDIEMIHKLLVSRFGFQESEIATILDAQATRAGILAALRELVQKSGPDDVVYVHYSGHGSQVKDMSGDEPDSLDQTLVPYDGRTGDIPDVLDDELGEILGGLRTDNALVILDSCHSGTATRSVTVQTRSIPKDTRTRLYVRPTSRAVVVAPPMRHVLMTGASRSEPALDGPIEGQSRGFFSYALGRVLSGARGTLSPREIHAGVKVVFRALQEQLGAQSVPEPQVEGPDALLARPVLVMTSPADAPSAATSSSAAQPKVPSPGSATNPARTAELASVEVRPIGSGRVQLVGGLAMGAAPGSRWAVYPPGEVTFESGGALATARVTDDSGQDAFAITDPSDVVVASGARAVLISTAPPANEIPVLLSAPQGLMDGIKSAVQKRMAFVQFVDPREFGRFIVEVTNASPSDDGLRVNVYGAGGLQLLASFAWADVEQAAERLAALFTRNANAAAIKSLANPASRMKLDVNIVAAGRGATAGRGIAVISAGNAMSYRVRNAGEPRTPQNSLMLGIQSDRDCYLTIIDIDSEGGVAMLFPNAQQGADFLPGGMLSANARVRIPDALTEPNRAGFFWDYSSPVGPDAIQVFATTDLESTRQLRGYLEDFCKQGGTRGLAGVSQRGLSAASDPLDRLRSDLAKLVTERGVRVVASTSGGSAAAAEAVSRERRGLKTKEWTSVPLTIEVTDQPR